MNLAPIGVSTYSRLPHLIQTIGALQRNTLASKSDLYIFSDAPKPGDEEKVAKVRNYIHTIDGFKTVTIMERTTNSKIKNARGGIRELLDKYGRIIFIEDDIVTAPGFLQFMNESLNIYEKDNRIFSITGYSPPIDIPAEYCDDVFILRRACGWGMGIWQDRFKKIFYLDNDEVLDRFSTNKEVEELSKYGEDLLTMILLDAAGKIDAFDVKIFYYQFLNEKYTIFPRKSLVRNIGHDGSGVHCGKTNKFDVDLWEKSEFEFNGNVKLDDRIIRSNYRFRNFGKVRKATGNLKSLIEKNKSKMGKLGEGLIFLISQPRAGSTLLQRILGSHPEMHTIAEPWIMLHPIYALKRNGIGAEYDFSSARIGLDDFLMQVPEGEELYIKALRAMAYVLYNKMLDFSGKSFFLDKTPRYYFIIPELYRVFPNAKFLFLLRNPLAVLSSVLSTWFGNKIQALETSANYKDLIKGPHYLIDGINKLKEDAIIVHYENLVKKPKEVIQQICNRIGIPFYENMLEYGLHPMPKGRHGDPVGVHKHNRPVPDYIDKWIENLTNPDVIAFTYKYLTILGSELVSSMGYSYQDIKDKLESSKFNQKVFEIESGNSAAMLIPGKLIGNMKPEVGGQKTGGGRQQYEIKNQKSKVRGQRSENREQGAKSKEQRAEEYLVSAIVSTYNAERFIHGRLQNLIDQTLFDKNQLEIIVIDSNSPQNEKQIVDEFKSKLDHIVYLRTQVRETVYGAWNRGIKIASGKYITSANTDDRLCKSAFEQMVKVLEMRPDIALVYADVIKTETENETFENSMAVKTYHWHDWDRNTLLEKGCFMGPQPMWRRSVHDVYGYFDPSLVSSGDYEFWLRISQSFNFHHIRMPLGLYLIRPDSIEHAEKDRKLMEDAKIRAMYHKAAKEGRIIKAESIFAKSEKLENVDYPQQTDFFHQPSQPVTDQKRTSFDLLPDLPVTNYTKQGGNILNSYEKMYQDIQPLLNNSSQEAAIAALKNLVISFPEFGRAQNDLGVLYYKSGDKENALTHYQKAAQLQPENITFQKNLADFYYVEQGRVEDALHIYIKVLELNPKDIETLLITGHICVSLQKFEDAKVFYNRALEIEPWNTDAGEILAKLENMAPGFTTADTPEEMYEQINSRIESGQPQEAICALQALLERWPDFALAHNDLGVLSYRGGDKEKSLRHYEEATQLEPHNITFQKNLADFYFVEQGRTEEALKIYVDVLTAYPEDIETLAITGHICVALNKFEDAKVFYNRVLEIEPWNSDARENLAKLNGLREAV